MIGSYVKLGPEEAGCRLAGGGHGTNYVDFDKYPGGSLPASKGSMDACLNYCSARDDCVAIEYDSSVPKCEIWWSTPDHGEAKAAHYCRLKVRAVPPPLPPPLLPPPSAPPPPQSPPPLSPDQTALFVGLGVGGGCVAALLAVCVVSVILWHKGPRADLR